MLSDKTHKNVAFNECDLREKHPTIIGAPKNAPYKA